MVSTRGHPKDFPEQNQALTSTPSRSTSTPSKNAMVRNQKWAHTPSNLTLIWLFISLPLVAWDVGYCMLRPYSMPGGSLHWPIWVPYELYGKVDHIYGREAIEARNGFTNAQSFLNIVESVMYIYYLYILYAYGKPSTAQGRGAPRNAGFLSEQRSVDGSTGALAVLVANAAAVMTVSKTVLYWMNEYYSGFHNIGHNSLRDLIFLWIIPNGAWLVVPSYIIYVTGSEIIQGLTIASGGADSSDDTSSIKNE